MTSEAPKALEETFGAQTVNREERRQRIRQVFAGVAPRYDLMNDLMSFGIHRLWKRSLRDRCRDHFGTVVDLAGGTGDVARLLVHPQRLITVCDPSLPMLQVGCQDATPAIRWLAGEAEALPFAENSVDLLVVSFGLRNVTQLTVALAEIRRVLKPGGLFVCLEFSRPQRWLAPFYDLYSRLVIPRLGAAVARQPLAYQYLIESIQRFPDQNQFADLIRQAGLKNVSWRNLSFGIVCLHTGEKP